MFELQIPGDRGAVPTPDGRVLAAFQDPDRDVSAFSLIPWAEHCTECAFPSCYQSCDLYDPRPGDQHCRRFDGGMVTFEETATLQGYVVGVSFRRWAKLMAFASATTVPAPIASVASRSIRRLDLLAAKTAHHTLLGRTGGTVRVQRRVKSALVDRLSAGDAPDYLLIEIYNPNPDMVTLTLSVRPDAVLVPGRQFQHLLEVEPGLHRERIPFDDIASFLDGRRDIQIELTPNIDDPSEEGLVLYFGSLAFVKDRRWAGGAPADATGSAAGMAKTVKIVAWDLDNTMWDGVLVEDLAEGLTLNTAVRDLIVELDRRGIVNTVVSKNDHDNAYAQLERFGLAEYIVFPHISWEPKSAGLRAAVEDFNVGADTVVFVDDQPFERAEVAAALPAVRVLDVTELDGLLDRPEFSPPVTAESRKRREFYRNEEARSGARATHADDYDEFLRSCGLRLDMLHGTRDMDERIQELVQRTNQMNFSGSKYSREELERYLDDDRYDHVVMRATDRFGDYGIIGFALIDRWPSRSPAGAVLLHDLMFSCRVQSKRVEHAFLARMLRRAADEGRVSFEARYVRTDRNGPVARVFDDLGFELLEQHGDERRYGFDLRRPPPEVDVVDVHEHVSSWEAR